jgi:hypothetical protein
MASWISDISDHFSGANGHFHIAGSPSSDRYGFASCIGRRKGNIIVSFFRSPWDEPYGPYRSKIKQSARRIFVNSTRLSFWMGSVVSVLPSSNYFLAFGTLYDHQVGNFWRGWFNQVEFLSWFGHRRVVEPVQLICLRWTHDTRFDVSSQQTLLLEKL